jgi:DNA repair exonuclease SbcCD ATPase subunit
MPRITIDRQNINPLWWTGEKLAQRKNLLYRIPPISEGVKAVIASKLSKKRPPQVVPKPDLDAKSALEASQQNAQIAREKLQHMQSALDACLREREHALSDVTEVRAKQLQQALKELEDQMRKQFEEELVTKEQECQDICEEMEEKMLATLKNKQREIDELLKQQSVEEQQANQEEVEPPTKRTKLDADDADASETKVVPGEPVRDSAQIEERKRDIEVRW